MDKTLSARINESVIQRIGVLAQELRMTKKAVIEAAIASYAEKIKTNKSIDVLEKTLGAWNRKETPAETVATAKREFKKSIVRHY